MHALNQSTTIEHSVLSHEMDKTTRNTIRGDSITLYVGLPVVKMAAPIQCITLPV
jgi:hypothetical protein